MDKISGILPSNARLKSVNLSDSYARSGTPSFGRPQAMSGSGKPFDPRSTAEKAIDAMNQMKAEKEMKKTQIALDVTKKFFETTKPHLDMPISQVPSIDAEPVNIAPLQAGVPTPVGEEEMLDVPVIGAHLDIQA